MLSTNKGVMNNCHKTSKSVVQHSDKKHDSINNQTYVHLIVHLCKLS